jgi:hypothetical protein
LNELFLKRPSWDELANSQNSLPRALFYLELSRLHDSALFISSPKRRWFGLLGLPTTESSRIDIHRRIEAESANALLTADEGAGETVSIDVPPIRNLILVHSYNEELSPIEAAVEIKSSKEATGYRETLGELIAAMRNTPVREVVAQDFLSEIAAAAEAWRQTGDFEHGVTHNRTQLSIGSPSWLPSFIDLSQFDFTVKIPTFDDTRHLAFISSWFTPAGQHG